MVLRDHGVQDTQAAPQPTLDDDTLKAEYEQMGGSALSGYTPADAPTGSDPNTYFSGALKSVFDMFSPK